MDTQTQIPKQQLMQILQQQYRMAQRINLQQQQRQLDIPLPPPKLLSIVSFPDSLKLGNQTPILNKIKSNDQSFFCGYSNGMILQYSYNHFHQYQAALEDRLSQLNQFQLNHISPSKLNVPPITHRDVYYPYQNCDVIDIELFTKDTLLMCTHTEVTLLNMNKNKRISLKVNFVQIKFQGHQQTPIAVSYHPVSPLVVSVSNLIIQHDLRMQKPILVNYITPPVYDIQFFPDGQFYFLSGQPCRIGKDKWMRTLQNGIGKVSLNSKFIVTNDMNKHITMWDWRKSQKILTLKDVKNQQNYQPIHFLSKQSINSEILFLQDTGNILHHDILRNKTTRHNLIDSSQSQQENWKCQVSSETDNTRHFLLYQHQRTQIKCYSLR